jgi:hypothetical protein
MVGSFSGDRRQATGDGAGKVKSVQRTGTEAVAWRLSSVD